MFTCVFFSQVQVTWPYCRPALGKFIVPNRETKPDDVMRRFVAEDDDFQYSTTTNRKRSFKDCPSGEKAKKKKV